MIQLSKDIATTLETCLNKAGCIPVVAIYSSVLRVLVGTVQYVAGIALTLSACIAQDLTRDIAFSVYIEAGFEHLCHGALNAIWGIIEFILANNIIPSLFILAGELCRGGRRFTPVFPYSRG